MEAFYWLYSQAWWHMLASVLRAPSKPAWSTASSRTAESTINLHKIMFLGNEKHSGYREPSSQPLYRSTHLTAVMHFMFFLYPLKPQKYQNHHHKLKPKLLSCSVLIVKIEKNQKARTRIHSAILWQLSVLFTPDTRDIHFCGSASNLPLTIYCKQLVRPAI